MGWERELEVLEEAIRRLNAEYDAFLYGSATKPPVESRKHVDQMIRRLSGVSFDVASERYRFATLQGRYSSLGERWERLQGEKESGRRPGLYGHFAAEPVRRPAASSETGPNGRPSRSVEAPRGDSPEDRALFERYLEARRARGEETEGYAFDKFAEGLERERARLRERLGSEDFVLEVAERDGKVKLIARRGGKGAGGTS